jgi:hypothetical protein
MQVLQVMLDLAATFVNGIWSDTDNLKQFQFDVLVKTVFLSFITASIGKIYK